ncbi:MAG: hypothetical protein AAF433_03775 [Bacteroidota bacterium]
MNEKMDKPTSEEEISLKDLILKIQEYCWYFWRKKWWLAIGLVLGAALFIFRGWDEPETYEGTIAFVVNEDSGGGSGGFGSILGQIGLGTSSGEQQTGKVSFLSRSRRIIYEMLLDSVEIEGEKNLLANHFITTHNLDDWFEKLSPYLVGYRFTHAERDSFERVDYKVLKLLHHRLTNRYEPLMTLEYDDDSGVFLLTAIGHSEGVALSLLDRLYDNLRAFYVETAVGGQIRTFAELQHRADSVAAELARVEYALAQLEDRSLGLTSQRDFVRRGQLQRDAALLNGLYIEVLRNKEAADFSLNTSSPEFEIIEEPAIPLASLDSDPIDNGILGAIFGGFLAGVLLFVVKVYRDIMTSEK